jgi:hypothetical protein
MRQFSLFQKFSVLCTTLLVVLTVLTAPAFAQATAAFGTVSGTVLDASGAPVPAAKVTVSNPSLGLNRDTRLAKSFRIGERMSLSLLFEVFNLTNTVSTTSVVASGFTAANTGTAAAPNFVVAPCASATATVCAPTTPGLRSATAGFPDGTNARRAEAGLRFVF